MSLVAARLSLRLGRFEVVIFGVLLVAAVVGALLAADHIASLAPPIECLYQYADVETGALPAGCEGSQAAFYEAVGGFGSPLTSALVFLPLAAGVFLGVPIVARELERGTSRLAWSFAPSRWRWYVARMAPALLMVAVLGLLAGHAADRLLAASEPGLTVDAAFANFGFRGVALASRALFVFCLAVAVGAIVGRALPAVILTAVVAFVGLGGDAEVHRRILATEAVPMTQATVRPGDMWIDQRFQLPDGSLVGWEYFDGGENGQPYDDDGNTRYPEIILAVRGERYGFAEAREAGALGAGSIVGLLVGGFVVGRRRPG
ncbi:MAG: hypothetical protein WEC14_08395 [Chloroflexota bacterium]